MKRLVAAAAVLSAVTLAPEARADDWVGVDKALHFGVSAVASGVGYAASSFVLERPWERAVAGAGFALALGASKELYDLGSGGDPSWKDFTWDVAGAAVGAGVAVLVDLALRRGEAERPASSRSALVLIRF